MKDFHKTQKIKKALFMLFLIFIWLGIPAFGNPILWSQSHFNTIVRSIAQGTDDAGLHPNGYFSPILNEIYFGECYDGQEIVSGFRFQDIQVSDSTEVLNAHLEFTVDGTYNNEIHIRFYGEAVDNSLTFSATNKPSDRPLTTQSVDWYLTSNEEWVWNTKHNSPNIAPILREIISRPGWTAGKAISIIVKNVSSSNEHRRVYAFEREGQAGAAKLVINAPPPPDYELYTMYPRVWVINFDPIIPSEGNRRLHDVLNWFKPEDIIDQYRDDIEASSHGLVKYRIEKFINVDFFPVKEDGFQYTNEDATTPGSYLYAYANNAWHSPGEVDYNAIVRDYDLAKKIEAGEVDEIWIHGGPYFGYYESRMAGRGSYWCNSVPMKHVAAAKIFVLMGFNYERNDTGLHILGHRTESILTHVYGSWSADSTHAWNRFTLYDKIWPGGAACGNVHFPPNGVSDYDYGNMNSVWSTHRDWLDNYPNLTGLKEMVNATEWGGGVERLYHNWWFTHIPHVDGSTTEYGMTRSNNWWHYIVAFNNYPESGDGKAAGFYSVPLYTNGNFYQLTTNNTDDWSPQINTNGRVAWYGFDGNDYEIYSAYADGVDFVQITDNAINDESPRINDSDQIVWQTFDGTDYEIFTAHANGSNLVQITNNQANDWHPHINNSGRLAWDGWDGKDYEIYSSDIDGANLVQITDNQALSGYPLEDVWAQINDNDRIVWMGFDGNDWDIFSANADGTDLVQISATDFDDEYPRLNNSNQVVWQTYHSDVNVEIHSAGADGQSGENVISNNSLEDWYPHINNAGKLVWMGHNGWNWDIYTADFDGSNLTQLTSGPTDQQYPQIDDTGFITWQGYDGNDWEIFGLLENTINQLSDNEHDDRSPHASNNNAVWQCDSGEPTSSDIHSFIINAPVPVELASFTSEVTESYVILQWTTATETNNFGFEIQRRQDKSNFEKIGFVSGGNTSTKPRHYQFKDSNLKVGSYYYRLKQIDVDGAVKYSRIIEVTFGVPTVYKLGQNYPNPFNPETSISFQVPKTSHIKIDVFNLLGQHIRTLVDEKKSPESYQIIWNGFDDQGQAVSSGVYLYKMQAGDFTAIKKMALVR